MEIERRYLDESLRLEERAAGKRPKLIGYAAVFNRESHDLGGIKEIILPTAFDRALAGVPDIPALINHDQGKVLGRTSAGTLRLATDERGLRVEIDPPDTTAARDLLESIRRGDIRGMSFAFRVPNREAQRIDYSGKIPLRYLKDLDIREVSVVTIPAYPDTSVALRAIDRLNDAVATATSELRRMRLRLVELE